MKTVKIQMYEQNDLKNLALKDNLLERFQEVCEHRLDLKDPADQDKKLKAIFDKDADVIFNSEEHKGETNIKFTGFQVTRSTKVTVDLKDESFSHKKSKDIKDAYDETIEVQAKIAELEAQLSDLKDEEKKKLNKLIPMLEEANSKGHNYKLITKNTYSLRRA